MTPLGKVVFVRTDTLDYAEMPVPFNSIEELAGLCCDPPANAVLEKVVFSHQQEREVCLLTFNFIAASRGKA